MMTSMIVRTLGTALAVCSVTMTAFGESAESEESEVVWESDYAASMAAAERSAALMVIYFYDEGDPQCRRFDDEVALPVAQAHLAGRCCVRVALNAEIVSGGEAIRLIEHPAFAELQGGAGLVVLDFSSEVASERGRVLRTLPFGNDRCVDADDLAFLAHQREVAPLPLKPVAWFTDFAEAKTKAEMEQRMLLIYFERRDGKGGCAEFEANTLSSHRIREGLRSYVCLRLAHDAKVNLQASETVLLRHASFSEMVGLPGIAVIDCSSPKTSYYGQVVSTFPFLRGKAYDTRQMEVILNLPPGKLTQRTLIYAVRTHPDAPQSTSGKLDDYLLSEAENHSVYQARIRIQGHHAWGSRFQRINSRLSGGLLAREVCAESWPGQCLLEAALDCVKCWRQSSGHWGSVRTAHPVFGYDMRRGSNGIWYATGIFGNRGR